VQAAPVSEPEAHPEQPKVKRKRRTRPEIEADKARNAEMLQALADGKAGDACSMAYLAREQQEAAAAAASAYDDLPPIRFPEPVDEPTTVPDEPIQDFLQRKQTVAA
jgi:hypothetical protein